MTLASFSPVVSLFLVPMLIAPPGWAQTVEAPTGGVLQVKVIDADSPQVPVSSRSARGFSVQVTDGSGVAIADAAVALRLPDSGASGVFADGSHAAVVYTDASGRAHVEGIQWNASAGIATMRITASKGEQHAGILVEETLVAASGNQDIAAPRLQAARLQAVAPPLAGQSASATSSPSSPASDAEDSAPLNTIAGSLDSVPVRPAIRASALGSGVAILRSATPSVSILNDGSGPAYHSSFNKKKWIMIGLAIAAGAGAAYAASSLAKGSSSSASSSSISIGAPTVSVGHP